ncbi:hypothetical protein OIDMADRAFT_117450, partial [Oidiodendron maius Zn]
TRPQVGRMGEQKEGRGTTGEGSEQSQQETLIERATLCLPNYAICGVVQAGDSGFSEALQDIVPSLENNALERLVQLKSVLRGSSTFAFWETLLYEICGITGAQCSFVTKRILANDDEIAVELPEPNWRGPCLVGIATYIHNRVGTTEKGYQYHADGTSCPYMRHNKVCIIPERFSELCPDSLNVFPGKRCEAFIGMPLFHEGMCFANFGVAWDFEGARERKLGWAFIELLLHSLEDMILHRILEGRGFAKDAVPAESVLVVPVSDVTPSQSLKPSKRAVEAADNVVHACDLNMQMPEAPLTPTEPGGQSPSMPVIFSSRTRGRSDSSSTSTSGNKRSSGHGADPDFQPGPPSKRMFKMTETEIVNTYYHIGPRRPSISGPSTAATEVYTIQDLPKPQYRSNTTTIREHSALATVPPAVNPTHRCVSTRELMRNLVNIALRAAHPTSEMHTETDLGETIEVRNLGSRGEMQKRTINLKIERNVPEMIVTDVQSLEFPIQKVLDNAIKFTESGSIMITVQLGAQLQVLEIWVADTGRGITEESKLSLFTPHFQEDASISRARDGLGLSLFNAKAHVRMALGGDVTLERSATEGPSKGSEFLIRLPISVSDPGSTDLPIVGIPPQLGQHVPITPTRPRTPNPAPRKRVAFNRHLAEEYPLNILIAEDNSINREVAMGSLNKLGYTKDRITVAYDGLESVQLYAASLAKPREQRFDAILMDIWMPNMDGFEATARILDLAREEGTLPKIIAVTADITGGCVDQAKASGMHGYLAKPYKVLDIEHLIIQHFGKA